MCASTNITLKGPLNEHGNEPLFPTLLPLDADYAGLVVISCQVTTPADVSNDFNPRLRFYLPRDAKVCTLRSVNGSHELFDGPCHGFNYTYDEKHTYYEEKGVTTKSFTYHVIPIARMDQSVVNCGVRHRVFTGCFGNVAAVISFQDGSTCSTVTNAISTTIDPATTTTTNNLPTTTPHSTTTPEANTPTVTCACTTTPRSTTTPEVVTPTTTIAGPGAISMKKDTFFSAVCIIILVGSILLLANFIQLWMIIRRRRLAATAIDEHRGSTLDQHHINADQRDIELEEVLENSMAKESG